MRLTQSIAKLEPGLDVGPVKVPVVYKQALGEVVVSRDDGGAVVGRRAGNGVGQLSAGADGAVQHIDERVAALLPRQTGPHHGRHAGGAEDALEHQGTDAVDDHDRVLVGLRDGLDELVAVVQRVQVQPVAVAAVHQQIALSRVAGQEDDGGVGVAHGVGHVCGAVARAEGDGGAILLGPGPDGVGRGGEVWVVGCAGAPGRKGVFVSFHGSNRLGCS